MDKFNYRRECYLLYLTIYNDILSRYYEVPFDELVQLSELYPLMCRNNLSPHVALTGLIKIGAFSTYENASRNIIVTLPRQSGLYPPI